MFTHNLSVGASIKLLLDVSRELLDGVLLYDSQNQQYEFTSPLTNDLLILSGCVASWRMYEELGPVLNTEYDTASVRGQYLRSILDRKLDFVSLSEIFSEWYKGDKAGELQINEEIFVFNQVQALFSKQSYIDAGYDPSAKCKDKFFLSESDCRLSNERIEQSQDLDPDVAAVVYYAQQKISDILYRAFPEGPRPISECNPSFGPGSNTSLRGDGPFNLRKKLGASIGCSPNSIPILGSMVEQLPLLAIANAVGLSQDSFYTSVSIDVAVYDEVPKNVEEHRGSVTEPSLTGAYQRCYGVDLKDALLLDGCNLRDQSHNQRKAYYASFDDENVWCNNQRVVTVDSSRASDTVSIEAVWLLLPFEWAARLDELRSPDVLMEGVGVIHQQKFSSMGNGYTFELESLIFWAVLHASMKYSKVKPSVNNHGVYGDDVIIPARAYTTFKRSLEWLGFSINEKKTHMRGYFRESCGHDYFYGDSVRPFFQKELVSLRTLYSMYNFAIRNNRKSFADFVYLRIVQLSSCPNLYEFEEGTPESDGLPILFGPNGYGDGHLIGTWVPLMTRAARRSGHEAVGFDTYRLVPAQLFPLYKGDWLLPSYSIYLKSLGLDTNDRDSDKFVPSDDTSATDPNRCRGAAVDVNTGIRLFKKCRITTFKQNVY